MREAKSWILDRLGGRASAPKPSFRAKRVSPRGDKDSGALRREFSEALKAAGGMMVEMDSADVQEIAKHFSGSVVVDTRREPLDLPKQFENVDLTILEGSFGVAENGAVWIEVPEWMPRELLTLSHALALTLPAEAIVPTMEDAYERLDLHASTYGLFMAGPSKTADIEQSLVLGAHGAMELKVFIDQL